MTMQERANTAKTINLIERFNAAFNRHDVDGIMALMTDDCVFESTSPGPDGGRFQGQPEVRAVWESLFAGSPQATFEAEEIFAAGDRCVVRWVYHWVGTNGQPGHIRGVDLFRVQEGKVAEKLSYVKG
jgi:ketosteroid isomerase-like protein